MLTDVAYAGWAVAAEHKGKEFARKIRVETAFSYVLLALGAGMEALLYAATPDFAPCGFLVFLASWAFAHAVLPASPAVKATGSYCQFVWLAGCCCRKSPDFKVVNSEKVPIL